MDSMDTHGSERFPPSTAKWWLINQPQMFFPIIKNGSPMYGWKKKLIIYSILLWRVSNFYMHQKCNFNDKFHENPLDFSMPIFKSKLFRHEFTFQVQTRSDTNLPMSYPWLSTLSLMPPYRWHYWFNGVTWNIMETMLDVGYLHHHHRLLNLLRNHPSQASSPSSFPLRLPAMLKTSSKLMARGQPWDPIR
jgi:hypothetical protein